MRILVGSGSSGSIAGRDPPRRLDRDREHLQPRDLVELERLREPPPAGEHRHRVGPADGRDRHDRHARRDRHPDEALAPGEHGLVAVGPRPQRVDLAARPQRDVVARLERRGDRVRRRRQHAHLAEVGADQRRRHQRVVRGAVQRAVGAEAPPPLDADRPRVPHERRAGVDADQQHRRLGQVLPALDLHPEPVVHQRVPEVLLAVHEGVVDALQIPLAGALGDPARGPVGVLATGLHLLARLGGVALALGRCHAPTPTRRPAG